MHYSLLGLHEVDGKPKQLDELYLDTTFCSNDYLTFPSRKSAEDAVWELVDGWVRKNGMYRHQKACHVVLFKLPAQYGSEAILNAVHRNSGCKWKIHVSQKKFEDYLCTQDLCGSVESDFEKGCYYFPDTKEPFNQKLIVLK